MVQKIRVQNQSEYYSLIAKGVKPLTDFILIEMNIRLRVSLQFEMFGESFSRRGNVIKANQRYYEWCWQNSQKICENCMKPLYSNRNIENTYSAVHISHILSRSNCPEMAHDPRNKNILCAKCHAKWEGPERKSMLIYPLNSAIITILKNEYRLLI